MLRKTSLGLLLAALLFSGCSNEGLPTSDAPDFYSSMKASAEYYNSKPVKVEVASTALIDSSVTEEPQKTLLKEPRSTKLTYSGSKKTGVEIQAEYAVGDKKLAQTVKEDKNNRQFYAVDNKWFEMSDTGDDVEDPLNAVLRFINEDLPKQKDLVEIKTYHGADYQGPTWEYHVTASEEINEKIKPKEPLDTLVAYAMTHGKLVVTISEKDNLVRAIEFAPNLTGSFPEKIIPANFSLLFVGVNAQTPSNTIDSAKLTFSFVVSPNPGYTFQKPPSPYGTSEQYAQALAAKYSEEILTFFPDAAPAATPPPEAPATTPPPTAPPGG